MNLQDILKEIRHADNDYQLFEQNDRIAIGLSGGKDSVTLLHILKNFQKFSPAKFELIAITLNPGDVDNGPLHKLCKEIDVPFYEIQTDIAKIVFDIRKEKNPCSLCAKMRKGALNDAVKEMGCNKVADAHHKDDIIETMMLSLIFEGRFYSFSPKSYLDKTGLTLIRPLMYASEYDIKGFQNKMDLPVAKNPCPVDGHTKRQYVKDLINGLNKEYPGIRERFFTAILEGNIKGWPPRNPKKPRTKSTKNNEKSE